MASTGKVTISSYLDDIIVNCESKKDLEQALNSIATILNKKKCVIPAEKVYYLGYCIGSIRKPANGGA